MVSLLLGQVQYQFKSHAAQLASVLHGFRKIHELLCAQVVRSPSSGRKHYYQSPSGLNAMVQREPGYQQWGAERTPANTRVIAFKG
jgi:hypothetical protein